MNKRLPLLITLLALIVLAASIAYWVLQLYKPAQRPLAAAPIASQPEPSVDAAATLFGGQPAVAAISNFQLTGVVAAGADSAAIIVADGAPAVAVKVGREIAPGVVVSEVHKRYVMLLDGGVLKRVELATDARAAASVGAPASMQQQQPMAAAPPPGVEPSSAPGVVAIPPSMQSLPPPGGGPQGTPTTPETAQVAVPEPQMDPGYDPNTPVQQAQPQQQQQQQGQPQLPPNAMPMNAPPLPQNQPSQQNPVR